MRKIVIALIVVVTMFLNGNITANAIEMTIYQLKEITDIKTQANADSETVVTLEKGTPVWQIEEGKNWVKIRYQEYTGYILSNTLDEEVSTESLNEEFNYTKKVVDEIYQETIKVQREKTEELVWKIGILVLAIAFIACVFILKIRKLVIKKRESNEE